MKAIRWVMVLAVAGWVAGAGAEENASRKLADDLLNLMDVQKNMAQTMEAVKRMQMQQIRSLITSTAEVEKAQAVQSQVMDVIVKELSWAKLKDQYISIYADTFTVEELQGLLDFYHSPVGQKFIQKMPELTQKSMAISQKQMAQVLPKIQEITKQALGPKPVIVAPVAPAPAAPAAPVQP